MRKHFWVFAVVSMIGLVIGSAVKPDPAWYIKKTTWQDTLFASRRAKSTVNSAVTQRASVALGEPVLGPWYQAGPYAATSGSAFTQQFAPELGVDVNKPCGGMTWAPVTYTDGEVHKLSMAGNTALYLYRTITSPTDQTVTGSFGSDDGIAVWFNGRNVISNNVLRGPAPDQDTAELNLHKGANSLLIKIYNNGGDSGFYFAVKQGKEVNNTATQPSADQPLWSLVQRDFSTDTAQREMAWEREDGIWSVDAAIDSPAKLANRYAGATRGFDNERARQLALGVRDAAGVARVRELYLKGRDTDERVYKATGQNFEAVRLAVADLCATYGDKYPKGASYLQQLRDLQSRVLAGNVTDAGKQLDALRTEALLANPLLGFDKLLFVKRSPSQMGLPQNWQGNSSIPAYGYDNEIDTLSISSRAITTLYKPQRGAFVGDLELHYDADRFLFSMPGAHDRFQVFEMRTDGTGMRRITPDDQPDVDNYSGCYLPDGRYIYCSTACYNGVPCVGGGDSVGALYLLDEQKKSVRQLTFDQDHSWYPRVANDGQVIYTRWEYSDIPHYFSRLLFQMNPDGTSQFERYGSNSYWPNTLMYARSVPNDPSKFIAIVSGHHGVARMGELVLFDPAKGRRQADGVVQRIPGYRQPVKPVIADQLVASSTPRFLHPYPLSDKYFLVSCQPDGKQWGLYLVDVFDNMICLAEDPNYALMEPVPLLKRAKPPVIPDRVKLTDKTATVFLEDVYRGPGLKGVPRGVVTGLRLYSNHYAYRGMGGHINVGIDGPWDVKRILGTVPVDKDGSAMFRVPANQPIIVQPIDKDGKAVAVMRSWYTAMPGEHASCVGCHETQNTAPRLGSNYAAHRTAVDIQPWYGPARGFSFEREVQQPVLQKYCVSCHNGGARPDGGRIPDFRARKDVVDYHGAFTPAYEALHRYVRRPGNESDYTVPMAAEWEASTSELVQMLKKGHHNVRLPKEAWDRLYTWIDLNVPCHGNWTEQNGNAPAQNRRMMQLAALYGGADVNHEVYPDVPATVSAVMPPTPSSHAPLTQKVQAANWPLTGDQAANLQKQDGPAVKTITLPNGVSLRLARIPAGEFVMGDANGAADEQPLCRVKVAKPFWMSVTEVTNDLYAQFDPSHTNGVVSMHNKDHDTRGYPLDGPQQPVVRISWQEAMRFCRWLSERTGMEFTLPTEAQWEYACRAGTQTPFWYGGLDSDFSRFANLGDRSLRSLAVQGLPPRPVDNPDPLLDWVPKDDRFNDGALVTTNVAGYAPNPWGLYDMHGNVAEWTRTSYAPYPYNAADGRDSAANPSDKVVRGGSWFDRPKRCTSSYRLSYPVWQGVYNVGFRVICVPK